MKTRLYEIEGPWPGKLAIVPRPRGADWLADEIAGWGEAGLEVMVSLLTAHEIESMELHREAVEARRQGVEMISFPIPDRGTPASFADGGILVRQLRAWLGGGKHIGVHCRQGIGRSALVAATLLILAGIEPKEAWSRIEAARGCEVPDTLEQKLWVEKFVRSEAVAALRS